MELTKKECLEALDVLRKQHDYLFFEFKFKYPYSIDMINQIQDCFGKLIEEHFDNQPLEFEKQLKRVQELELKEKQWIEAEKDYRDELKKLKSNPPLEFEDLKVGSWVWDNAKKIYRKIYSTVIYTGGNYIHFSSDMHDNNWEFFEKNRFYKRETT